MLTATYVIAIVGSLSSQVERAVRRAGYGGLVAVMVVENVFPPIPSEVVLPFAGFEVSRGHLTYAGAVVAATAGSLIGAWVIYAVGRVGGRPLVLRMRPLLRVSEADLERAEGWFEQRGDWIVLGARLVPGARSVVSAPAGMLGMPILRFSVLTAVGSSVWNAVLIALGFALRSNWTQVTSVVGAASTAVVVVGLVALVASVAYWRRHSKKAEQK